MKNFWHDLLLIMMLTFLAPMVVGMVDILAWFWTGTILSSVDWNSLRILMAFMLMVLSASCLIMLDEHYWSKRK